MLKILRLLALSGLFSFGLLNSGFTQDPTPTAQGQIDGTGAYTVVSGDTLYGIAARYGLSVAQLTHLNDLAANPVLYVGQRLVIATGTGGQTGGDAVSTEADHSGALTYVVQAGDTLFSIAQANKTTIAALSNLNRLASENQVYVGQILTLRAGQGPTSAENTENTENIAQTKPKTHQVLAGQTLFSIAREHGVDVADLAQLNALSDPGQVYVGQILQLPGGDDPDHSVFSGPVARADVPATEQTDSVVANPVDLSTPASSPSAPLMLPSPPPRRGSKFHWPARGKITTHYGSQSNGQTSDGIEIQVGTGANILAAEDGIVAFAGTGVSGYGYLVLIKHADDYYTAYGQNSSVIVTRGDVVRRGQLIARAGNATVGVNGRLHFEVRYREEPVNPIAYMAN